MTPLINADEARRQLRLTTADLENADRAADVADKAAQATAIIVDYIEASDNEWTAEDVPLVIKAAILLMLTQLFDDPANATVSKPIKNLLRRTRPVPLA